MEVRIAHALSSAELASRLSRTAAQHDIELKPNPDGRTGTLAKDAGFLGSVRAEYSIEPDALVVRVSERPPFLPEEMLRRTLEGELGKLVAG